MRQIIFGFLVIIGGATGHFALRGTRSSMALVIAGVVFLIIGIVKITQGVVDEEEPIELKEEEHTVTEEKLQVYNKAHESTGVLIELEIGSKIIINFSSDLNRFYKVRLLDGQTGYMLKTAKYS